MRQVWEVIKMIKYENDCVGCPTYCINCGKKHSPHYFCDWCDEEFEPDELYDVNGDMVCQGCILGQYEKIKEVE